MADPISAAATAFASWVGSSAFAAASGASITTAANIAGAAYITAYAVAYVGLTAAVSVGLNAIARSQTPDVEGQKLTRKQPRPIRVVPVGGPSRMSGAYMLRETVGNKLGIVLAICEGRITPPSRYYLNDDRVTLNGGGWVQGQANERYGTGDLVNISMRLGLPTETRHSNLGPSFSGLWPSNARGDGIASLAVFAQHRSRESFARHFPNGEVIPSLVTQSVCYDWRDPTQDRTDETTWKATANPIVWLVHLEWYRFGRSWDRCIAPVLVDLTAEAAVCDEMVPLKAGGTEPRYRVAGNYPVNTEPQGVRDAILASMDGWMSVNGRGHLILKAGRYEEPTFTITGEHIEGYSWRSFQSDEDAVNELVVSYVSADQDFTEVEAGVWRDESDISDTGKVRSEALGLTWVHSRPQSMRLAKRKMSRLNAPRRGNVLTGIYGLNGLGKRFIRVQNPELASMSDVALEVMDIEINFDTAQVIFDVILADPDIDDWSPEEEEGEIEAPVTRPDPEPSDGEPARRLINQTVPYPTSADETTISIAAFSGTLPDGAPVAFPAFTMSGLAPLTQYGVFYNLTTGYAAVPSPATASFATGSNIFIGWQATADDVGGFPDNPTPPGGWGGDRPAYFEP